MRSTIVATTFAFSALFVSAACQAQAPAPAAAPQSGPGVQAPRDSRYASYLAANCKNAPAPAAAPPPRAAAPAPAHRAIAFVSTDPDAERAWWEKVLGAKTTKEDELTVSTIPGARLLFSKASAAPASTRGRSLDHTGIGVKDVAEFCNRVAAQGVVCERLFNGAAAMITDPAGVAIEVNAGLESR